MWCSSFPRLRVLPGALQKEIKIIEIGHRKRTSVSHTTENRIEMGRVSRIRFADIISLDAAIHAWGRITAMFWRAALFHTGLIRNEYYDVSRESKSPELDNSRMAYCSNFSSDRSSNAIRCS